MSSRFCSSSSSASSNSNASLYDALSFCFVLLAKSLYSLIIVRSNSNAFSGALLNFRYLDRYGPIVVLKNAP
jgi:hypothetical protein